MKIIDSDKIFNQLNALSSLYCYAQSINNNNCVTPRTKIIIVGTITPPDGNGYFYTSQRNRVYGYIDAAYNTNLKALKTQLHSLTNPIDFINKIKLTLISKQIAFLDVFESVIRKTGSPYDSDIKFAALDYINFQTALTKLKEPSVKVICNSLLAEKYFNVIMQTIKPSCKITSIYLSQRYGKKCEWIKELK